MDDVIFIGRNPMRYLVKYEYNLKGVGKSEHYHGKTWFAKTYIKNVTDRIENLLETKLRF